MRWLGERITRARLSADRLSVLSLIVANAIPLVGVLLFKWSTFEIVALYWFENVALGVINVLKMITCAPDPDHVNVARLAQGGVPPGRDAPQAARQAHDLLSNRSAMHAAKLFLVPFFIVHYGLFCFVHGVFVVALLGPGGLADRGGGAPGMMALPNPAASTNLLVAAVLLAASHGLSFVRNYLIGGEYRRTLLPVLMVQPYARIVVLHLAILLGAFLIVSLGSPTPLLLILVAGKTLLDLSLHLAEHNAGAPSSAGDADAPTTVPPAADR